MSDSGSSRCFAHMKRRYLLVKPVVCRLLGSAFDSIIQVEFQVNGVKQDYAMKLGEGGEAFFVFETAEDIPASLQTSPLVSPAGSPKHGSEENLPSSLQEPEYLDLNKTPIAAEQDASGLSPAISIPLRGSRSAGDLGST